MDDQYTKYFNLSIKLVLTFLGFIIVLIAVLLGLRLLFGLLDQIPWFVFAYMLFIVMVPPVIFITIFIVYFKRTAHHPSAVIRGISYSIFTLALLFWIGCFGHDIFTFFKKFSGQIGNYYGYNIYLLTSSVVLIFFVGILQALSSEKEKDWLEKRHQKDIENDGL